LGIPWDPCEILHGLSLQTGASFLNKTPWRLHGILWRLHGIPNLSGSQKAYNDRTPLRPAGEAYIAPKSGLILRETREKGRTKEKKKGEGEAGAIRN